MQLYRAARQYRFPHRRKRDWRRADNPIGLHELTPAVLAQAHRDADISMLPQTVWPSRFIGHDFISADCLVASMAIPMEDQRPSDAAPGTQPLLTVLPHYYYYAGHDKL